MDFNRKWKEILDICFNSLIFDWILLYFCNLIEFLDLTAVKSYCPEIVILRAQPPQNVLGFALRVLPIKTNKFVLCYGIIMQPWEWKIVVLSQCLSACTIGSTFSDPKDLFHLWKGQASYEAAIAALYWWLPICIFCLACLPTCLPPFCLPVPACTCLHFFTKPFVIFHSLVAFASHKQQRIWLQWCVLTGEHNIHSFS